MTDEQRNGQAETIAEGAQQGADAVSADAVRMTGRSAEDRSAADQNVADQNVADQRVVDQSAADQNVTDQKVTDQRVAGHSVVDPVGQPGLSPAARPAEQEQASFTAPGEPKADAPAPLAAAAPPPDTDRAAAVTTAVLGAEAERLPREILLDLPLEAHIQFGTRTLPLAELLEVGTGDVLELDRNVEDPVDLVVGGRIVARGEVVLVQGNFALEITEVIAPQPRLELVP